MKRLALAVLLILFTGAMTAFAQAAAPLPWCWFRTCSDSTTMVVEVSVDGRAVYNSSFAICRANPFEGPDGRIHWRDCRLEWPVRHGFIDLVAREFHAGKMMFPPKAS